MTKGLDCVEMKRRAQERIRAELAGKTRAEELAYWAGYSQRLRTLQSTPPIAPAAKPDARRSA